MSIDGSIAPLINRLRKNARHLGRWARREGLEAWRVYDRDMPEFPYAVDCYGSWLHVQLFAGKRPFGDAEIEAHRLAIAAALEVEPARCVLKLRSRQRGSSQYEKLDAEGAPFVIVERGLRFEVNLTAYLDTGLFLDHRDTRAMVRREAAGKRFLNLFAYTGSFTVYAAAGEAASTLTIDLSQTYQDWTWRNLVRNGFDDRMRHRLLRTDVTDWLAAARYEAGRYDLIVLDPPSFSNSKRMRASFDVQRDQAALVSAAAALLAPGGRLYFSNNRQGFRLDASLALEWRCEDITSRTVPEDFRRRTPHRCWLITRR